MSSTADPTKLAAMLRSLLLAVIALTWMGATGEVRAAKPDPVCDGLTGLARGLCAAATALGCGVSTKHQKQCDVLAARYETLTGLPPPWEEPVYPSNSATLRFDYDVFDLETGTLCDYALLSGAACNGFDTSTILPPNDFWVEHVTGEPNPAVLIQNQDCGGSSAYTPGIIFLDGVPFGSVDASILSDPTTPSFETGIVTTPFGPDDTIVLLTCEGNYFKIGNARCNDGVSSLCQDPGTTINTFKVDYERLVF